MRIENNNPHQESVPGQRELVVIITDSILARTGKIGYALRSLGWKVILLHGAGKVCVMADVQNCFDEMIPYRTQEEAITLAQRYQPIAYHVCCAWNYRIPQLMIRAGMGPMVMDNYDGLGGMLRPEFIGHQILDAERFAMENADGICARDLIFYYQTRKLGYCTRGETIFFPDYCWDFQGPRVTRAKLGGKKEPHIVYAGGMNIEKYCRNDPYQMQFKNGFFLDFGKDLAEAGIHFHLYVHPNIYPDKPFEEVYSEFLEASQKFPFFHLHRSLKVEHLIDEISAYDFGLESAWLENRTIGSEAGLPIRNHWALSNKCFDYTDAGLGLALDDDFKLRCRLFDRFKVVLKAPLDHVKKHLLEITEDFYAHLPEGSRAAREYFSVRKQIPRLVRFYQRIAQNRVLRNGCRRKYPRDFKAALAKAVDAHIAAYNDQNALQRINELTGNVAMLTARGNIDPELREAVDQGRGLLKEVAVFDGLQPKIFFIETSSVCQAHCPECGKDFIIHGKRSMSFDRFKILVDKIRPFAQYIYLDNQHEMKPFADYCISLGLNASFNTPYFRPQSEYQNSDSPGADARDVFTIHQDGTVIVCGYDQDGEIVFGNIFEQDVLEIWNSPQYREYRWNVFTGRAP